MHYTSPDVYEFIAKKNTDPILERRTCRVSGARFPIYQSDKDFLAKVSPVIGGKKYLIPFPTLCPEERCRRRLLWQNMRHLYRRTCDATGQSVLSNISPDKPLTVYDQPYWRSDAFDFKLYGKTPDFNCPFFGQLSELLHKVPQPNMLTNHLLDHNSHYTNYAGGNKNCYLIFHADMNEDCFFGVGVKKCLYAVDTVHAHSCKHVYECVDARNCFGCFYSQNIENCSDSYFLSNCLNCQHCFGCNNLVNKQYCRHNQQLTKSDYDGRLQALTMGNYYTVQQELAKAHSARSTAVLPGTEQYECESCIGDLIFRSHGAHLCFDTQESRNIRYSHRVYNGPNEDVSDVNEYGMCIKKIYEGLAIGINASDVVAGLFINEEVNRIYYGMHVHHSSDIFGCIAAVNARHCILNKAYTKHEYEETVAKLIAHMQDNGERGEFFDPSLSPFGYNETVAQEYYPLTREEALARGYKRQDVNYDPVVPSNVETLSGDTILADIAGVNDSILKKILLCEVSGRPYRIIKQELDFYRKHNIPLPRKHPDIRHQERLTQRPGRSLYLRMCDQTGEEILSVYPEDAPFKVYSEGAYREVVFG